MMIFRILCGEWIEPLWDCMRAEEEVSLIAFPSQKQLKYTFQFLKILARRFFLLCHIPTHSCHGQFYGAKFVLGLVAQQLQFGRAEIEKRGKELHITRLS